MNTKNLREKSEELIKRVLIQNQRLQQEQLAILTWGNASAIDRREKVIAIKPSGVEYSTMTPDDIVLCDLEGKALESELKPSSDLPTHLALYAAFEGIGGIVHAHSPHATAFAQAGMPVQCFGTTHADNFYGAVPVTDSLSSCDTEADYEKNTGLKIVDKFRELSLDPLKMRAVLVANHGPFVWGESLEDAVENAIVLEAVSKIAFMTRSLSPDTLEIPQHLLDRHFLRKHGETAYYGQK